MNALVVDDDETSRELLKIALEEAGVSVTTSDSGENAWAQFISGEFELFVLDWVLPGIDGLELCRRIRATPRGVQATILVVSARSEPEAFQEALNAGADDFFTKPLIPQTTRERIAVATRGARAAAARASAEASIRMAERRLSAVAESLPVTLFALDARATCVLARGSALQDCLGLESSPVGADFRALLRPYPRAAHTLQAALAGNAGECTVRGVGRVIELRFAPVLDGDDGRVINGIAVDVTERMRMLQTFERSLERVEQVERRPEPRSGTFPAVAVQGFHGIIGSSPQMDEVFELIRDYARVNWAVLITGETGTGKELVARAIHDESPRAKAPYIAVNCAGLSVSLLQSQLFGHRKGAFTGATADQAGYFEAAHGGTLFLDEIGDIGPEIQMSLLRVLEEGEITRVGESHPRKVDVRVITATNRDLQEEVREGRFRSDLMYRIRVARIALPPLRERRSDLPDLTRYLLGRALTATGKKIDGISEPAMMAISRYDWPGNVRELRAAIEFAVARTRGTLIERRDLPPELQEDVGEVHAPLELATGETTRIRAALAQAEGNRSRAARILGISRATLYRRLAELEIS